MLQYQTETEVLHMAADESKVQIPHNLIMQNRRKLSLSGVQDVENFDEREVVLYTSCGKLTIHGVGLHMERLSVDEGDLTVEGTVDSLEYSAETRGHSGFFSRLFG